MRKCPNCNTLLRNAMAEGPIMYVTSGVSFAEGDEFELNGVVVAKRKIDMATNGTQVMITCPACRHVGALVTYLSVFSCMLSGINGGEFYSVESTSRLVQYRISKSLFEHREELEAIACAWETLVRS